MTHNAFIPSTLPPYLHSTQRLISCAFPEGPSEEHYWPLLVLLYDGMCHETLAMVMSHIFQKDFWLVANDLLDARLPDNVPQSTLDDTRHRLLNCGYAEWVKIDDLQDAADS